MEEEIWKDIKGYEGLYQVSNLGRIKSLPRKRTIKQERILKYAYNNKGYKFVILCKNSITKKMLVHRIVAENFIPNIYNKPCINHKDSNPKNNNVENLEWCTHSENMKYSWIYGNNFKYKKELIWNKELREKRYNYAKRMNHKIPCRNDLKKVYQYDLEGNFIREFKSVTEAAKENNVNLRHISNCCRGMRKRCGNFQWSFVKQEKLKKYERGTRSKRIVQILDDKVINEFNSITEASRFFNVSDSLINQCLKGKLKTAVGYKWKYKEE